MISIQAIWDDTLAFIRREQALLVPVALATIGVSSLVIQLIQNNIASMSKTWLPLVFVAGLLAIIVDIVGQLAVTALALRSHLSVREALAIGAQRMWVMVAATLLVALVFGLLLVPLTASIMGQLRMVNGMPDFGSIHPDGGVALWGLVVLLSSFWANLRLTTLAPMIVDRKIGVIDALKGAFQQNKGLVWKLLLTFGLMFVVFMVLSVAVGITLGTAFVLLGKAINSPSTGQMLVALVTAVLGTAYRVVMVVFIAKLYQRLVGGSELEQIFG